MCTTTTQTLLHSIHPADQEIKFNDWPLGLSPAVRLLDLVPDQT